MIEEIDTNNNFSEKEIPDGEHTCRVFGTRKNGPMYIWNLSYDGGREGEIVLFANTMGPLLKALGCKEGSKKGFYILDTSITDGGTFKATFYSEPDKKDKDIMRKRMKNVEGSEVPY